MAEGHRALAACLAFAAALPAAAAAGASAPSPAAPVQAVVIDNMQFTPASLQVRRGERIVWTNKDLVPHTVTARDGSFDSHAIAPGASWRLVASHAGAVDYACLYHPAMVAHLVVR
ncbi:MAG: cupredoxin family copper-binding protein [Vitreoscilla sp.]